jgi:hypothetical protein
MGNLSKIEERLTPNDDGSFFLFLKKKETNRQRKEGPFFSLFWSLLSAGRWHLLKNKLEKIFRRFFFLGRLDGSRDEVDGFVIY